jgi:hypothetical protein
LLVAPRLIVLDQSGHDPRWLVVEVYDDAQPASRIEVAAIEVLAAGIASSTR